MRKIAKKIICCLTTCCLVFTSSIFAVVTPSASIPFDTATVSSNVEYNEKQVAVEIYKNLSPEAKLLFDQLLTQDEKLRDFHQTHVDPTFQPIQSAYVNASVSVASNELSILSEQLSQLNLPQAVVYSLEALGASMAAAVADGPLPIGDILLAAAAASTAVVVAANWSTISAKWNSIVDAFTSAFTTMVSNITSAFEEINSDVPHFQSSATLSIYTSSNTATIGGVTYAGTKAISDIKNSDVNISAYYVAILIADDVVVDTTRPISYALAKAILIKNNMRVGIFAPTKERARSLAGAGYIGPENHDDGSLYSNYYMHYHNSLYSHAHIWYPNFPIF